MRKFPNTPGEDLRVKIEMTVRSRYSVEVLQAEFERWLRGSEPMIVVSDDQLVEVLVLEAPVIEVTP